jgi:hypothetical protein
MVEGLILPAPIETATRSVSGSMVSMRPPIDRPGEQEVDVFVAQFGPGAEEMKSFPVANPGLKLNAEQVREPEDGRALALCVGVDRIRQHIRVVLDQIHRASAHNPSGLSSCSATSS